MLTAWGTLQNNAVCRQMNSGGSCERIDRAGRWKINIDLQTPNFELRTWNIFKASRAQPAEPPPQWSVVRSQCSARERRRQRARRHGSDVNLPASISASI